MPISLRPTAAAVFLLVALLAPSALAQELGRVELSPAPSAAEAEPGAKALFRIEARNAYILEQNVALSAVAPAGWTYNFTPANASLAPGTSANFTLEVFVPADAETNATVTLTIEARGRGTDFVLGRAQVNVTVVAPPPAPGPAPPAPPELNLAMAASTGSPGQTVEGVLTLRNRGATSLEVRLAGQGPAGWNPRFLIGDDVQVLHPGEAPRAVHVYATVPSTAAEGSGETLRVVATVGAFQLNATWSIQVVAPPAPEPDEEPAPGGAATTPAGSGAEIPVIPPERRVALDARVADGLIQVAPGESAEGTLRLENVGTTTLSLRLVGRGPTDWPAPVPEKTALALEPGQATEVRFTLRAPADVIPSTTGRGQGDITLTSDDGLMRSAPFQVMVVPGAPRDETTVQDETPAAVVTGGEGSTLPLGALGLATAAGAVGAGALALANRPLREKLLWGAVGLYTRLARPDVLGHEDREKLYRIVETTPGIHFHALQRDLAWNTGTLTYHLRVLERHGFVVSRRDGLYRRFYLSGAAPRKEVFENQGPSGLRADVLEAIRSQHGMSQTDLALALGANKQTVNYHVKALERQGLIRLEKRGRETFLYPANVASGMPGEARA